MSGGHARPFAHAAGTRPPLPCPPVHSPRPIPPTPLPDAPPAAEEPDLTGLDADDALMVRLQAGDGAAFEELVARHEGPLFGFFLKNTRRRPLAEDLTQDTLLKLYRQNWDFLPVGRFRGWLYRIARNLLIDHARKGKRDALVRSVRQNPDAGGADVLDRVDADADSPPELADRRQFAELVDELLDELPAEQREAFTMHHFAHVPLPEVGQATGVKLNTVKSRLRLAREKLRAKLADRGVGDPWEREKLKVEG